MAFAARADELELHDPVNVGGGGLGVELEYTPDNPSWLLYTTPMPAKVRIKPELITEHRLRIEMRGLEDEDIENTIRMKGWAWVRSREAWVYAGEPDFVNRQIREVIIGLPEIYFDEGGIEESIRTVEAKARSEEERAEGRDLLRRALEKTGQLDEARGFLEG